MDCTIYNTVDIIGKKWALIILLELHRGNKKEKRFNEIKKNIELITSKILTARLRELEKENIISRRIDKSTIPNKSLYSLTQSGKDMIQIIQQIKNWGLKWKFNYKECKETNCKNCTFYNQE